MKFKFSPRLLLAGLAILTLGLTLRLVWLNSLPVFADESIYVRWAQVMRAEPSLRFLPLSDGKQPLYMWAIIPFLKVISDPVLAGRIFSALVGFATAPIVAALSFLLFKKWRPALLSGFLWLIIPFAVFFNRMALVDSLLTFFITLGFVLAGFAFIHRRWDFSMLAGFAFGFAWLTKSPALFALALLPTLIFLPDLKRERKYWWQYLGLLFTIYIIAFSMYNILRLGPQFHMLALRNKDYIYPLSEILAHPFFPLAPNAASAFGFFVYFLTPVGLALTLWGLVADRKNHLPQRLLLFLWLFAPLMFQLIFARNLTARYLLLCVPFALVLISHAVEHISSRVKPSFVFLATSALVVLPALGLDYLLLTSPSQAFLPRIERAGYLEEWTAGTGLREVAAYLAPIASTQPVLVGSEGFFGTPFDALSAYLNPYPQARVIGVGVWIDSVSDKLSSALSDNQVYLVVNSSRFHADPEDLGLRLIAAYPKARQPNGDQEYLLFFQVTR